MSGEASPAATGVLVVYGTRPEAIKLASVVELLRRRSDRFQLTVCSTGQHEGLVASHRTLFDLEPDVDLEVMRAGQGLSELMARCLIGLDRVLGDGRYDWLLVQGDTTSAAAAAVAGFHRGVAVGHVEAGLRSGDLGEPFPEEANRRLITLLSRVHFAPTRRAASALAAEGVDPAHVIVTGNTVIDALARLHPGEPVKRDEVLVTVHRRENHGAPLEGIASAVARLAGRHPELTWIWPLHPNPSVHGPVRRILGGLSTVRLVEPLEYPDLLLTLAACRLALTDSGGIQEEAPSFGTPVLVLRGRTERPEGLETGAARLIGTDPDLIVAEVERALAMPPASRSRWRNPYGDGQAAERIVGWLAGDSVEPFGG